MGAPLSGMTGFGRADRSGDFGRIEIEARSVNGKGLDVRLRLAPGLEAIGLVPQRGVLGLLVQLLETGVRDVPVKETSSAAPTTA